MDKLDNTLDPRKESNDISFNDLQRERELVAKENFGPSEYPSMTEPVEKSIPDGAIGYGHQMKIEAHKAELNNVKKDIVSRNQPKPSYTYGDVKARNPFQASADNAMRKDTGFNPYAGSVNIRETHEMNSRGVWKSKYPYYAPKLNNEDLYARNQTGWNKFTNGMAKLGAKTLLYGLSGVVAIPNTIYGVFLTDKPFETELDKIVQDLDQSIDLQFAHYYRKETENYNFWERLTKDTGNFIWNDFVGSGVSFTTGAMLSSFLTGGLGLSSLGTTMARAAMRKQLIRSVAGSKSIFNKQIRNAVARARTTGEMIKGGTLLLTSAGHEAAFEATSFVKESEKDFEDYYRNIYGRRPTVDEMADFKKQTSNAANLLYGANLGILSLSNFTMFGSYFNKLANPSKLFKGKTSTSWVDRNLFGVKTEVVKPGEMAIKVVDQTKIQKATQTAWNISKRPLSEGVWEEGMQGVVSGTAEDYVASKYNRVKAKEAIKVFDSFKENLYEQYHSKEGLTEVGIGAVIGSLFGIGTGFGALEGKQQRSALQSQVDEYNKKVSGFNTATINMMKQAVNLTAQLDSRYGDTKKEKVTRIIDMIDPNGEPYELEYDDEIDVPRRANSTTSREFDMASFEKFASEYELGMLDDSFENFCAMIEATPNEEIARDYNINPKRVDKIKEDIINDYKGRLEDFRNAYGFASDMVGESNESYRDYIANTLFMGRRAERSLEESAKNIKDMSGVEDIERALNAYKKLSDTTREKARSIFRLKSEMDQLEKDINSYATGPKNEAESKRIQELTAEKEGILASYREEMEKLSRMIKSEFDSSSLTQNTKDALEHGIALTAEDVVSAYGTLSTFDNFINKSEEELQPNERLVRDLVYNYREQLLNYRKYTDTLKRMLDPRFGAEEENALTKSIARVYRFFADKENRFKSTTREYKEEETPGFIGTGSLKTEKGTFASDEAIDKAVEEGKISENEAFSFKTYLHMLDYVRGESQEAQDTKETIDDRSYNSFMDESIPNGEFSSTFFTPGSELSQIIDDITSKIYNGLDGTQRGVKDTLTPRERDIYNKFKTSFDERVKNMGDNPMSIITKAREKFEKTRNWKNTRELNEGIIGFRLDELQGGDRDDAERAIDNWKASRAAFEDGLIGQDEMDAANENVRNIVGGIGTLSDIVPLLEQNFLIDNNPSGIGTLSEPLTDDLLEDAEGTGVVHKSVENAQNPAVLMARKVDTKAGPMIEISGLNIDEIHGRLAGLPVVTDSVDPTVDSNTGKKSSLIQINGMAIELLEAPSHGRVLVTEDGARIISENTDMKIQGIGKGFSIVMQVSPDGKNVVPYETGNSYGNNEVIDQESLSEMAEGDDVTFHIDYSSDYTKRLYDEYVAAKGTDREDAARERLMNGLVIRIHDKDGNFVSVVRETNSNETGGIMRLRRQALSDYLAKREGKNGSNLSGTETNAIEVDKKSKFSVSRFNPGKPNFNTTMENGVIHVESRRIEEKDKSKVAAVGYIINGKIKAKWREGTDQKTKNRVKTGPYVERIANDKNNKDMKIPIVVIEGKNGVLYAYPVSLAKVEDRKSEEMISRIDGWLQSSATVVPLDFVSEINAHLLKMGLDLGRYAVPVVGDQVKAMEEARRVIEREKGNPDIESLVSSRKETKDSVLDSVLINVDVNNPFVAPKIRVDLSSIKENVVREDDEPETPPVTPETKTQTQVGSDNAQNGSNNPPVQPVQQTPPVTPPVTPTGENSNGQIQSGDQNPAGQVNNQPTNQDNTQQTTSGQKKKKPGTKSDIEAWSPLYPLMEDILNGLKHPEYINFFDFLARSFLRRDIKLYRNKGHKSSINTLLSEGDPLSDIHQILHDNRSTSKFSKALEGNYPESEHPERVLKIVDDKSGHPTYIEWLRSINEPIVQDYLKGRTEKEILNDLKIFLEKMGFTTLAANTGTRMYSYVMRLRNKFDVGKTTLTNDKKEALKNEIDIISNELQKTLGLEKLDEIVEDDSKNELDLLEDIKKQIDESIESNNNAMIESVFNRILKTIQDDPNIEHKNELINEINEYYESKRKRGNLGSFQEGAGKRGNTEKNGNGNKSGSEAVVKTEDNGDGSKGSVEKEPEDNIARRNSEAEVILRAAGILPDAAAKPGKITVKLKSVKKADVDKVYDNKLADFSPVPYNTRDVMNIDLSEGYEIDEDGNLVRKGDFKSKIAESLSQNRIPGTSWFYSDFGQYKKLYVNLATGESFLVELNRGVTEKDFNENSGILSQSFRFGIPKDSNTNAEVKGEKSTEEEVRGKKAAEKVNKKAVEEQAKTPCPLNKKRRSAKKKQ